MRHTDIGTLHSTSYIPIIIFITGGRSNLTLEMWANAQRDGCPAEYRWHPLFNAAKFGWCPLLVPCWNATRTRNLLTLAGVPQTNERISAASRLKFTILWGHVEEILQVFFLIVDMWLSFEDIAQQKLCDDAQMAIFGDFFCVLHFQRAACSRFQTCILNSH